jgi:hypothetical protein
MKFIFGSLSLINFDLFAGKFGDKIKEIKIICHKQNNDSNCCNSKCNKKCNVKLVYKSLSQN